MEQGKMKAVSRLSQKSTWVGVALIVTSLYNVIVTKNPAGFVDTMSVALSMLSDPSTNLASAVVGAAGLIVIDEGGG